MTMHTLRSFTVADLKEAKTITAIHKGHSFEFTESTSWVSWSMKAPCGHVYHDNSLAYLKAIARNWAEAYEEGEASRAAVAANTAWAESLREPVGLVSPMKPDILVEQTITATHTERLENLRMERGDLIEDISDKAQVVRELEESGAHDGFVDLIDARRAEGCARNALSKWSARHGEELAALEAEHASIACNIR
jgi:hypothetical protein